MVKDAEQSLVMRLRLQSGRDEVSSGSVEEVESREHEEASSLRIAAFFKP